MIGWGVIAGNFLLFIFYYLPTALGTPFVPQKVNSFISTIAVFPLDFYSYYFEGYWLAQFAWIFVMTICGFGILLLNRFARDVFIVLNIIHIAILTTLVVTKFGHGFLIFLEYFFRLYFSLVASGTYVGFLTIPEVREQFKVDLEEIKLRFWFLKTRLQKSSPRGPYGYYDLGIAYNRLNRFEDAVKVLEKAISINPEDENFHFHLGLTRFRQKKYKEAISAFKETVRLNPIYTEAHYQLGLIYRLQGCAREAVSVLEKASHADPENAKVQAELGRSYHSAERFEDALRVLKKAALLNPHDDEVFYLMARILVNPLEDYKEAEQVFKRAVALAPNKSEVHFQLGLLYVKMSRYKDAIRSFKEAIRLDDNHIQAHYQLGFTYSMLKDFDSARREYRFLKESDPDLANNLAMVIK